MRLKNKEYFLLIFSTVLFLSAIGTIAYVSLKQHAVHNRVFVELRESHELAEDKGKLISEFYESVGYLGMIHNFKNAVLRGDVQYLVRAEANVNHVLLVVDQYQQLRLTEQESVALLNIQNTIMQYLSKINIVRSMIKQSASSEQIDQQVRIDDMQASLALGELRLVWKNDFDILEARQESALEELETLSSFGVYSFPLYFVMAFGFVWFLYRYIGLFQATKNKVSESEEFISDIITSSADAIISIDSSGKIVLFNPASEKLFGYQSDEITGKNVSVLMPENERAAHDHYVSESELYATRIINKVRELQGLRQDGSLFPLELNVSRMKHHAEPHFIGICRDITERVEIEKNRQAAHLAAEKAVLEAEKASQAKSQFLSSMSHELRTPLNAVIGFSQIVKMDGKDNLTDDQLKNIDEIENAGHHLLELINDVLDLSKIESGIVDLNIEPLSLTDLMAQCEIIISPLLKKYRVTYSYAYEKCDQIVFNTDHLRLKQILLNLLSNACKYNKPGGTVDIHCERIDDSIRISIIDSGMGINYSEIKDLFEPFNRMGAECSQIEGTGIGLNITLKLVELLGGNLGIDSTPGKGSHFWIDLPLNPHGNQIN